MGKNTSKRKTGTLKKPRAVMICLVIGLSISFLLFFFCVFVYIYKSWYISNVVASMVCGSALTPNEIKAFEALQAYYRDASNFNIISLLYVLISSVFMGALGLYIQQQKEQLDKFDKKRKEFIKETDENKNNFVLFKSNLDAQKETLKELSGNFDKVNIQYARSNVMQYLGYAQMFAANINTQCSNDVSIADVSEYTTRFRDSINNPFLKKNLKVLSVLRYDEKKRIYRVNSVHKRYIGFFIEKKSFRLY